MERDRLKARLKAARLADRVIDRTRSVDSRDPTGCEVAVWVLERERMVDALRIKVDVARLAILANRNRTIP